MQMAEQGWSSYQAGAPLPTQRNEQKQSQSTCKVVSLIFQNNLEHWSIMGTHKGRVRYQCQISSLLAFERVLPRVIKKVNIADANV